jgi:hypothetical protein
MTKRKRSIKETGATQRARSERKRMRAPTEPVPVKTDDPAKDKTEMEGSVLQPLPHAD